MTVLYKPSSMVEQIRIEKISMCIVMLQEIECSIYQVMVGQRTYLTVVQQTQYYKYQCIYNLHVSITVYYPVTTESLWLMLQIWLQISPFLVIVNIISIFCFQMKSWHCCHFILQLFCVDLQIFGFIRLTLCMMVQHNLMRYGCK